MRRFAALIDQLSFQPAEAARRQLLMRYFADVCDPERGLAVAALVGTLGLRRVTPATLRGLIAERVDPVLFELSLEHVGDLAETVALVWPEPSVLPQPRPTMQLSAVLAELMAAAAKDLPLQLAACLDVLPVAERYVLIKLLTGGLRSGLSERQVRQAIADFGGLALGDLEELWHALVPPYSSLFAWAEGRAPRPQVDVSHGFRPLMPVQSLPPGLPATLDPAEFAAQWQWDDARIQIAAAAGRVAIYSRTGDDITARLPELDAAAEFDAVLDGELRVVRDGRTAPLADAQHRLGRKTASKRLCADYPAYFRLHDLLFLDGEDLRGLPFNARRARLEAWFGAVRPERFELAPLLPFATWEELEALRRAPPDRATGGLVLQRRSSAYLSGGPQDAWFGWRCDPQVIEAVLMYAQCGRGERSGLFCDCTFGVWQDGKLVPVGRSALVGSDADLQALDEWIRNHTVDRFGPVREVEPGLVLEVAFDGIGRSTRRKAGFSLRSPRISRIRWDRQADDAGSHGGLSALLQGADNG